jgi:uncharacterized membrane protein YgcG
MYKFRPVEPSTTILLASDHPGQLRFSRWRLIVDTWDLAQGAVMWW